MDGMNKLTALGQPRTESKGGNVYEAAKRIHCVGELEPAWAAHVTVHSPGPDIDIGIVGGTDARGDSGSTLDGLLPEGITSRRL